MAAPLTKICKFSLRSKYLQVYCPVRYKYWEWGEDCIHQKGEYLEDRLMGIQRKNKKPHPETQLQGQFELDPPKGQVADKKPFPALLKKDKLYKWCSCGYSKQQPFCDGSHKVMYAAFQTRASIPIPQYDPFRFKVPEDGEYWMCNCKQSNNRPFCDGTHKLQEIQDKIKR